MRSCFHGGNQDSSSGCLPGCHFQAKAQTFDRQESHCMTSYASKDLLVQLDNNVLLSQIWRPPKPAFIVREFAEIQDKFPHIESRHLLSDIHQHHVQSTVVTYSAAVTWMIVGFGSGCESNSNILQSIFVCLYILLLALFRSRNHKCFCWSSHFYLVISGGER